ncbi:MAG TPA: type II toxin-antitoxin system VapC family toxin [Thermoanaerobaculia bacterium]
MTEVVLDASALLALLLGEPGAHEVEETIPHAVVSTVNYSEVVAKLANNGMPDVEIRSALASLDLELRPFDRGQAFQCGLLRPATRHLGLSLGDRACLALGVSLGLPVLTMDRAWARLSVGVTIRVVRGRRTQSP